MKTITFGEEKKEKGEFPHIFIRFILFCMIAGMGAIRPLRNGCMSYVAKWSKILNSIEQDRESPGMEILSGKLMIYLLVHLCPLLSYIA